MSLTSRRQRDLEQKRRMARGKRNLSQLDGPVAQGQRTPMNRGSGSVSTVQAPPFPQSDPGGDITQAALAYKGGKGLFDFTQGKEAYIDEAGNAIKATKPWTIGGESIGDKLSGYGDTLSGYADQTGEALSGLFSSPNPTAPAGSYGASVPGSQFAGPSGQNLFDSMSQSFRDMPINSLFGDTAPMMQSQNIGGMGASFPPPQTASNLMGSPTSAFAGSQAGLNEAAMAADALQASQAAGDISATAGGANGLQTGAKGAGNSFSSALPYLSIGLDLGTGGNTPITGDPYGDAAVRAAAAYATSGFSELGYGLGSLFDWW
jgi:hypothetical protein